MIICLLKNQQTYAQCALVMYMKGKFSFYIVIISSPNILSYISEKAFSHLSFCTYNIKIC